MSSNLMETEKGGEQTQYEGEYTDVVEPKKSGGQMGQPSTTTDPSNTDAAAKQFQQKGEKTAVNVRYGQALSEGGMSGFTAGQSGEATQGQYGQVRDQSNESNESEAARKAQGYGGKQDHNREVGA